MFVTERDLLILKMCLEQKFMTLEQIAKKFFPESRDMFQVPMKRVRLLVKAKLLKAEILRVDQKRLYMTTVRGLNRLKQKQLSGGLGIVKELNVNTWEHDEWVTDVRIHFEKKLKFESWISERTLKKENVRKKVPDGIIGNDDGQQRRLIIEVERHLKNKRYYEEVFSEICTEQYQEDIILYIVEKESEKEWLKKQAGGWVRIFFATMNGFTQGLYDGAFENSEHCKVGFNEDGDAYLDKDYSEYGGLLDMRGGDREAQEIEIEYKKLKARGLSEKEIDKLWKIEEELLKTTQRRFP